MAYAGGGCGTPHPSPDRQGTAQSIQAHKLRPHIGRGGLTPGLEPLGRDSLRWPRILLFWDGVYRHRDGGVLTPSPFRSGPFWCGRMTACLPPVPQLRNYGVMRHIHPGQWCGDGWFFHQSVPEKNRGWGRVVRRRPQDPPIFHAWLGERRSTQCLGCAAAFCIIGIRTHHCADQIEGTLSRLLILDMVAGVFQDPVTRQQEATGKGMAPWTAHRWPSQVAHRQEPLLGGHSHSVTVLPERRDRCSGKLPPPACKSGSPRPAPHHSLSARGGPTRPSVSDTPIPSTKPGWGLAALHQALFGILYMAVFGPRG